MADSSEHTVRAGPFPVSVLMERRRLEGNPWVSESWKALGVTVGSPPAAEGGRNPLCVVTGAAAAQYLWTGLSVALFADEAESYYHNLMVRNPGCYVVTRPREDGMPEPVLVTLSFDAGQAYQEAGETVYAVPLPPELYRATEAFVIANYVPEKKKKRKLENWKEAPRDQD
jgi:hypothetical protein